MKIDTTEQLGDIFTKGLSQPTFEYLDPKLLVGNYAFLFQSCICPVVSNTTLRGSVDIDLLDLVILEVHPIAVSVFSCALSKQC